MKSMEKAMATMSLYLVLAFFAAQFVAFFNCFARIYTRDGAGFQLDTLLYPFYKNDSDAGVLDDETAKFLISDLIKPFVYLRKKP